MLEWQSRVIEERNELDVKIQRLKSFLASKLASELNEEEERWLMIQLKIMEAYSLVLDKRISFFAE